MIRPKNVVISNYRVSIVIAVETHINIYIYMYVWIYWNWVILFNYFIYIHVYLDVYSYIYIYIIDGEFPEFALRTDQPGFARNLLVLRRWPWNHDGGNATTIYAHKPCISHCNQLKCIDTVDMSTWLTLINYIPKIGGHPRASGLRCLRFPW